MRLMRSWTRVIAWLRVLVTCSVWVRRAQMFSLSDTSVKLASNVREAGGEFGLYAPIGRQVEPLSR